MTFAYDPKNIWLKQHQMSINGKWLDITRADLLVVAKDMNIKKAEAIIDEVVAGVKTWKKCAKAAELSADQTTAIRKLHLSRL